ncbi:hypothetical protein EI94DRAFT_1727095 [Lactarius quietus]|nr:hypothetical protein EI94DRAFT_1727095 [Lactarius quietus]
MSYLVTLVVCFLATLSVASPVARQAPGFQCDTLNIGSNFALIADGHELVLAAASSFGNGPFPLVTSDSQNPDNVFAELFYCGPPGPAVAATSNTVPLTNGELTFNGDVNGSPGTPAQVYCGQNFGGTTYLAFNGDAQNFALCNSNTDGSVIAVYNPGAGFDLTSCSKVSIEITSQ